MDEAQGSPVLGRTSLSQGWGSPRPWVLGPRDGRALRGLQSVFRVVCLLTSITEKTVLCARGLLSSESLPREEALVHVSKQRKSL